MFDHLKITVDQDTPLKEVMKILDRQVEAQIVLIINSSGELIGTITDGDIRRIVAAGRMAMTIDDAMTRSPVVASPGMLASAVLAQMNEKRITQMFVLENEKPVGVVHMHDFLKVGVA